MCQYAQKTVEQIFEILIVQFLAIFFLNFKFGLQRSHLDREASSYFF